MICTVIGLKIMLSYLLGTILEIKGQDFKKGTADVLTFWRIGKILWPHI